MPSNANANGPGAPGSGSLPSPRALSTSWSTENCGLRERSSHAASARRPSGFRTLRVSRSAVSGSASSM